MTLYKCIYEKEKNMRLTVNQLRRIIKEEVGRVLENEEMTGSAPEVSPQEAKEVAEEAVESDPDVAAKLAAQDPKKLMSALQQIAKMDPEDLQSVVSEGEDQSGTFTAGVLGGGATALAVAQMLLEMLANSDIVAYGGQAHSVMQPHVVQSLAIGLAGLGVAGLSAVIERAKKQKSQMSESRRKTSRRGRTIREGTERLPEDYMAFCNAIQFIKDVGRSGQRDFPRDGHVYPITKQPMLDALKVISRTASNVGSLVDPKTYNHVRFVDGALGDAKIIVTPASSLDYYDEMDRNYGNY
jgi:hypothetical protein